MSHGRHRCLRMESLEGRQLMAADLTGGVLTVTGTNADDAIQLSYLPGVFSFLDEIVVDDNGVQTVYLVSDVDSITILGLAGNDQIGMSEFIGKDTAIFGGKGNDTIQSGSGNDEIFGDAGDDVIDAGIGSDHVEGGKGNDSIIGGDDDDEIFGDAGNDTIDARNGGDFVAGGKGNDSLHGGNDNDVIHGDAGNDLIWGDAGHDALRGNTGNDTVEGGDDNDVCHGSEGNDTVRGNAGEDEVWGDNGNDFLWGGNDNDFLDGGSGNDDCRGEAGDDEIKGGIGTDDLNGDSGNNLLDSDAGNDTLVNGLSCDLDGQVEAVLVGSGGRSGSARHYYKNDGGQLVRKFELGVAGMPANTAFDIVVDGITVGQVTTDNNGEGELTFATVPTGNDLPWPSIFPTVREDSTVSVDGNPGGTFIAHFEVP